jgi:hypothetical protein
MEFLAPWAGITAAAIAVPTLLALYLLKLRRRPARVSTIEFWPKADDDLQANVPLRMVKPSWLLFLHLLILALLLLAIARPMVKAETAATSRVVFLIDRSASMAARDIATGTPGPDTPMQTRLDLAKDRARELVRDLRRGVGPRQIGVVAFASEPIALSPLSGSSSAALDAIDSVTQTDEPGDLRAALALIEALASPSASEEDAPNDPLTVYILGDGSYSGDMPGPVAGTRIVFERIGPALAPLDEPLGEPIGDAASAPEAARVEIPASVGNLGIVGLAARRDYQDPATLRVFVEVLNATGAAATVPIALSLDGVVIDRKALAVPALDENAKPGGRASVVFERTTREGGILVARLGVEDALVADDAASLIVAPAATPLLALVRPDPSIESADQAQDVASILLADALAEMRARTVLQWRVSDVESMLASGAPLDQWPDLIVFDRVAPSVLPPVNSLHLGAWPDAAPGGITLERRDDAAARGVMLWDRDDPILRDVGLDALRLSGGAAFAIPADARGVRELARTSNGPVIIAIDQAGTRRVATAFALRDSNWPVQASFPIFLANVVESLTMRGEDQAGQAFRAGEGVTIPTTVGARRVVVRGAGMDQADLVATVAPGERSASVGRIERVGIYKVEGDAAMRTRAIAVNMLDATESALAAPEQLAVDGRLLPGVSRGTSPREIWPWLLIAATVLLSIEWLVFSAKARA